MSNELMNSDQLSGVSADDLMDLAFSDIKEQADFILYPRGVYVFQVDEIEKREQIGDNNLEGWQFSLKLIDVVELANEEDAETVQKIAENEQPINELYLQGFGYTNLRTRWGDVAETLGTATFGEFMEKLPGTMVQARVEHRKNKKNPDMINTNLKEIQPVSAE